MEINAKIYAMADDADLLDENNRLAEGAGKGLYYSHRGPKAPVAGVA